MKAAKDTGLNKNIIIIIGKGKHAEAGYKRSSRNVTGKSNLSICNDFNT
jgi:hypothetical protein